MKGLLLDFFKITSHIVFFVCVCMYVRMCVCVCVFMQCYMGNSPTECEPALCLLNLIFLNLFWKTLMQTEII